MLSTREIRPDESRTLYAHMERDFPRDERPPHFAVARNMRNGVYTALFLCDDDREQGYAIVTAPQGTTYALINFLAIFPQSRSKRYGSAFLRILIERFSDRTIVLEVESPDAARDDAERALRQRRIAFYERAGFHRIPTQKARIFGVEMQIMTNARGAVSARDAVRSCYRATFPSECWMRFIDIVDA